MEINTFYCNSMLQKNVMRIQSRKTNTISTNFVHSILYRVFDILKA